MTISYRQTLILFLISATTSFLNAQNQHDYTWLLGLPTADSVNFFGGSYLHFKEGVPDVRFFDSPVDLYSPCVVSDNTGNLQFYTNGCQVLNKQHELMENGDNINAGELYDAYCANTGYASGNAIFSLPYPGQQDRYVIFHIRHESGGGKGMLMTEVDMAANNGLGKVTDKNVLIVQDTFITSMSATRHGNGRDW